MAREALFVGGVAATALGVGCFDWRAGVVLLGVVCSVAGFWAMAKGQT